MLIRLKKNKLRENNCLDRVLVLSEFCFLMKRRCLRLDLVWMGWLFKEELDFFFFFIRQKTAYDLRLSLVGSEMCIRVSTMTRLLYWRG